MTEWSWGIDEGLLLCGAVADSFSGWLFFLTRLAEGLLCAVAAGSDGVAGQVSGQHSYPLLPLTPAECFSLQE